MTKGKVTLYGAGGCGINLVKRFYDAQSQVGIADLSFCMADTSRSNLTSELDIKDCFILPDVDGSGKIRKENYDAITRVIQQIPINFPAGDLNIVVFSGSGGSGSTMGPLIIRELLKSGHPTVGIVIGSFESYITANNTMNTIKSLDAISRSLGVPVVISFENNIDNTRRKEVDDSVSTTINLLARLASREHSELDTADLKNWLGYHRHTDVPAQLSLLEIVTSVETASQLVAPISIASLIGDVSLIGSIGADYQCTGYFTEATKPNGIDEIHYVVGIDDVKVLVTTVANEVDRLEKKRQSRAKTTALVSSDGADDNGMVL